MKTVKNKRKDSVRKDTRVATSRRFNAIDNSPAFHAINGRLKFWELYLTYENTKK